MKKKFIIGIIVIVVIVGAIGLSRMGKNKGNFITVKTASVTKGDIKAYFSTTATIKSKNSKDYFAPSQAKVKTVNVKVGDKVKKGQVLVTYQVQDLNAAVKQAQINLSTAQSQKQDLINTQNLNNQKLADTNNQITDTTNQINNLTALQKSNPAAYSAAGGDKQLQTLNSTLTTLNSTKDQIPDETEKLKQADNSINLAQVNLNTANENLANNVDSNVADFDGVVTALNAQVGNSGTGSVASGSGSSAAVTIEDQSSLEAEVNLDKYSASEVKVGEGATLNFANKNYTGKVSYVAPSAETSTSSGTQSTTLTADVDIDAPQDGLVEGFDADVNILTGESDNVIKVPAESIKTDKSGNNYVFVISNGKAYKKEVQLGLQSDTDAEIKSGLNTSDKVILNPSASIQDGTLVKTN
ncbi:HlyD family secretion protein [Clostridium acidisoli DSM 12555]|jgi:HlyD family secretion protein|uniref:HlyD family secretion protein n=1 Tax=Clostridium acidisoli DSM 12555 TaxID=1121291 RepID=A0A1W1XKM1_9CLOT|nr:HlyD family efflux transporter periplasmic adaptor subunit [Clostridium acidisoli]SMC24523.1 HlyD family secretion protein [Clostridium acidisoli DSM 12555]